MSAAAVVPNAVTAGGGVAVALSAVTVSTISGDGIGGAIAGPLSAARFEGDQNDVDGFGATVRFKFISALCLDADREHLLIGDETSAVRKLKRLTLRTGSVVTIRTKVACYGLALDPASVKAGDEPCDVLIASGKLGLRRFNRRIDTLQLIETPDISAVRSVCATPSGVLIVCTLHSVHVLSLHTTPPQSRLLAGKLRVAGFADGEGADARFDGGDAAALWGERLFVADYSKNRIRCVQLTRPTGW